MLVRRSTDVRVTDFINANLYLFSSAASEPAQSLPLEPDPRSRTGYKGTCSEKGYMDNELLHIDKRMEQESETLSAPCLSTDVDANHDVLQLFDPETYFSSTGSSEVEKFAVPLLYLDRDLNNTEHLTMDSENSFLSHETTYGTLQPEACPATLPEALTRPSDESIRGNCNAEPQSILPDSDHTETPLKRKTTDSDARQAKRRQQAECSSSCGSEILTLTGLSPSVFCNKGRSSPTSLLPHFMNIGRGKSGHRSRYLFSQLHQPVTTTDPNVRQKLLVGKPTTSQQTPSNGMHRGKSIDWSMPVSGMENIAETFSKLSMTL